MTRRKRIKMTYMEEGNEDEIKEKNGDDMERKEIKMK